MSRRFSQNDRNRRELEVLHRLAVELPRSLTLVGVTDALARELVLAIDRADECTISTWDAEADTLGNITTYERERGIAEEYRNAVFPLSDWPESRTLLREANAYREYRSDDDGWKPGVRHQLDEWLWQTWIGLPLVVEGTAVGLIEVVDYVTADRWSPRDIAFCQTIAAQAAMAVRNAQLYEHLRRQVDLDSLTGLLNHRALHERVGRGAGRGAAARRRPGPDRARSRRLQGGQRPRRPPGRRRAAAAGGGRIAGGMP